MVFFLPNFLDINECELDVQCHPNATCVDTVGSYMCACSDGYQGNGVTHCSSKFLWKCNGAVSHWMCL